MTFKTFVITLLFPVLSFSQVGIGTADIESSAMLQIESSDKGFLLPRMTSEQRIAIKDPAEGLLVYQTNNIPNLYCFVDSKWTTMTPTDDSSGTWTPTTVKGATASGFYQRVGNIVSFYGTYDFNGSGYSGASIETTLPIASNFANIQDANGIVSGSYLNSLDSSNLAVMGMVKADQLNNKLIITIINENTQNPDNILESKVIINFSGMYLIK